MGTASAATATSGWDCGGRGLAPACWHRRWRQTQNAIITNARRNDEEYSKTARPYLHLIYNQLLPIPYIYLMLLVAFHLVSIQPVASTFNARVPDIHRAAQHHRIAPANGRPARQERRSLSLLVAQQVKSRDGEWHLQQFGGIANPDFQGRDEVS